MNVSKKDLKYSRFGFTTTHKKLGVNYWRFVFTGISKDSGVEETFFIEYELLNPWQSPSEVVLGFKPRVAIKQDDLQYALAGTSSAFDLEPEKILTPSFVAIRIGKLIDSPKQLTSYTSIKNVKFNSKPFEMIINKNILSESLLSGEIEILQEEHKVHPEYMCDFGKAKWKVKYEIQKESFEGYKNPTDIWFPMGMQTTFSGEIEFDDIKYNVIPQKSFGYIERFWGKTFNEKWFHLSSCNLTSIISGKPLFNSSFVIHGIFEDKVSFIGNFEGNEIAFYADNTKRGESITWNCIESPEPDEDGDSTLHWSVSINNKLWIIDIDVYSKVRNLFNRKLELPEGKRQVLNFVQSACGRGEIKLYKKVRNDLEQIEYARVINSLGEYGQTEEHEL